MEPASADTGFFQSLPKLENQFLHDPSISRVFKLFLPPDIAHAVAPELARLGDEVLQQSVFDWVTDAERNQPYVSGGGRDAFGQPVDTRLVVSEGWRRLQAFSIEKGLVSQGYDEPSLAQYARVVQYLRQLLFESSSANVGCPAAMSDGAARVLKHNLRNHPDKLSPEQRHVFQNAYDRLTSRDPNFAWTSGQWMTERIGGSDVSRSETVATYDPLPSSSSGNEDENSNTPKLGPWRIDGFKWFSSATDSNMTILLARTSKGGLSAFYAPMKRPSSSSSTDTREEEELNGVKITRLKSKLGTRPLPTAELELRNTRAWLLGVEGNGVREMTSVLTITRIRSAISALGYLSRGLSVARGFAVVREVGSGRGKRVRLVDNDLHMRTLADMTVEYHGMMLLVFYAGWLLGVEERVEERVEDSSSTSLAQVPPAIASVTPSSPSSVSALLRVLTPTLKAYVTHRTVTLLHGCMEALGGVGYLENAESEPFNVARLFRDACVLPIWEGTTDVLATDLVRALKHPREGGASLAALEELVSSSSSDVLDGTTQSIRGKWEALRTEIETNTHEDLVPHARRILWTLAEILMAVLFALDVKSDDAVVVREMFRRYLFSKGFLSDEPTSTKTHRSRADERKAALDLNRAIVFGPQHTVATVSPKL